MKKKTHPSLVVHPGATGRLIPLFVFVLMSLQAAGAETQWDRLLPVRGFCISAPDPGRVDAFIDFIRTELAPRHINTLILRVDYNFSFSSHPELGAASGLGLPDARRLGSACRTLGIRVIPQINLLGHQSWEGSLGLLLQKHPEFDETPRVAMPARYAWPNPDGLYCKSYCPLHPAVHQVVFDLVDEVCRAFEADAFHAGMDEVFFLGDRECPRCAGKDKAMLFAGEVTRIRDHLKTSGRELWIWGDRLLDGKTTGLGMWEASENGTHPAIDLIPKDVVICDWHYERADATAVYFAMKGFRVVTCPWRKARVTTQQTRDMIHYREAATALLRPRFLGVVQTSWNSVGGFFDQEYRHPSGTNAWASLRAFSEEFERAATAAQ